MFKQRLCIALTVVAVLAFAAPGVAAAQPASTSGARWVVEVWQLTAGSWLAAWPRTLSNVWGSEGGTIDPWGQPTAVSTPSEGGYALNPAETWDKVGLSIDPDGAPAPATSGEDETERGVSIDPMG